MALSSQSRALLKEISTATLTTVLFKRGFRNAFIQGIFILNPKGPARAGRGPPHPPRAPAPPAAQRAPPPPPQPGCPPPHPKDPREWGGTPPPAARLSG